MKVILSRKGFDSNSGGGPSPIVDGTCLVSLPIPYENETVRQFNHVRWRRKNLGPLLEQLHPKHSRAEFCHLDPDIRHDALEKRHLDWRPMFGQAGASAGHLRNLNVEVDDLFLFFGLFRNSDGWNGFIRDARELHVIYGWLQVAEVITNPIEWARDGRNKWARTHPHTRGNWRTNRLFIAKDQLEVPRRQLPGIRGAGIFQDFDPRLQLTAPDSRSRTNVWRLPIGLRPDINRGRTISYLKNAEWRPDPDGKHVRMDPGSKTNRWQEAVISGNNSAVQWAVKLIEDLGA